MAKVDVSALTIPLQGRIGEMVFRKVRGQLIAALRPKRLRLAPPTENQLAQQKAFRDALNRADVAMADPVKRAVYERVGEIRNKDPRALAVGDWFHAPSVDSVDLSGYHGALGDKIGITASDDVAVRSVAVRILRNSDGAVLEQGPADASFKAWVYTAKAAVPANTFVTIEVTATDWADKEGKAHRAYPS